LIIKYLSYSTLFHLPKKRFYKTLIMKLLQNIKIPPYSTTAILTVKFIYSTYGGSVKALIISILKNTGGIRWNLNTIDNQCFMSKNSTFPPIPPLFMLFPTEKRGFIGGGWSLIRIKNPATTPREQ